MVCMLPPLSRNHPLWKVGLHGHTYPTRVLLSLHPSLSTQYTDSIGCQAGEDLANNCFVVVLIQNAQWVHERAVDSVVRGQTKGFFKRHFKRKFVSGVSHRFFGWRYFVMATEVCTRAVGAADDD